MASSSRSAYRFLSTASRAQAPSVTPSFSMRSVLSPTLRVIAENAEQRERDPGRRALFQATESDTPPEIEGRKQRSQHEFLSPDELTRTSLYAPNRPRARPPLLGPKNKDARRIDPFHISRSSPLDHVFNPLMGHAFVNAVGRIQSRAQTGLTWKSQRAVGKLIRRQRAMGIIGQWTNKAPPGGFGSRESDYDPRY